MRCKDVGGWGGGNSGGAVGGDWGGEGGGRWGRRIFPWETTPFVSLDFFSVALFGQEASLPVSFQTPLFAYNCRRGTVSCQWFRSSAPTASRLGPPASQLVSFKWVEITSGSCRLAISKKSTDNSYMYQCSLSPLRPILRLRAVLELILHDYTMVWLLCNGV